MIDARSLFDYYSSNSRLNVRNSKISLVGIRESGPVILQDESMKHLLLENRPEFLLHFAIFSMTSLVQGSTYRDEVMILPVAKYPHYQALVIGVVIPGSAPIQERYYQILLFLPQTVVGELANLIQMRNGLIQIVQNSSIFSSINATNLLQLKSRILEFLEKQ